MAQLERTTTIDPSSFRESQYYNMVNSLHSQPLFYFLGGDRERSDFIYTSTETGLPLLHLWEDEFGKGRLLTPGDEPIFPIGGAAAIHPSKPLVVFPKDKGGNGDYQVYFLDYSRNDLRRITEPIGRLFYTFWVKDDNWVIVGHDQRTVYARLLFQDGKTQDLYTTDQQILGAAYDRWRGLLAISVGRESAKLAVIDASTGRLVQWAPDEGIPPFYPPSIYPEKGLLAYTVDKLTISELVIRSIETLEELNRIKIPGFGFLEWVDETRLFGILLDDGRLSPRIVDIRNNQWSPPLTETSALFSAITRKGPVWVANSFLQPPFLQALRDGRVHNLTSPNRVAQDIRVENHHYASFDGRRVQGWLLRNPDPNAPVVIYLHGGPTALQGDWWYPEIPAVAMAGYHIFAPNFRGSDGYGKEFRDLNIGDLGGGDLEDVRYAARYAARILGTKSKAALFGGSYGGYLTLEGLVTQPGEWAGGVAIAPDTDWTETYGLSDAHYRRFSVHFFGGTPEEKPDLYKDRSPITHLKNLTGPALILHGDNDKITPLQPVKKFAAKAKEMGLPVDLVITPDEGHGSLHNTNYIRDIVLTLEQLKTIFQTHIETAA
jgi:pimeloyl-ACP methyl ester carboxylesterase